MLCALIKQCFKVVGWSVMSCATNLKIKSRPKFQYHLTSYTSQRSYRSPAVASENPKSGILSHGIPLVSHEFYRKTARLQECKSRVHTRGTYSDLTLVSHHKPLNLQLQNHPLPTTQFIFKS